EGLVAGLGGRELLAVMVQHRGEHAERRARRGRRGGPGGGARPVWGKSLRPGPPRGPAPGRGRGGAGRGGGGSAGGGGRRGPRCRGSGRRKRAGGPRCR